MYVFYKIPDCMSETATAEMRAVYKLGVALLRETQE